ncbi:DedA family protein [Phnomibacter sp. MR]|uniref:DedA family protein n=1 Tax=Phnomibacter sp. MR TaxID=3042318 RepID=UPI003A80A7B7
MSFLMLLSSLKRLFVALVLMVVCSPALMARQDSLYVVNQYSPVKNTPVTVNGTVMETNGMGLISFDSLPATDSLRFEASHHDALSIATKDISNGLKVSMNKHFTWQDLLTPMFYIINGGLWLLLFIIFAETGLFAGFFLPGDSLLFVAGIYSTELASEFPIHGGGDVVNLLLLWILISACGILGNMLGYWTGRKVGPAMYHWKENFFFKRKYLYEAHDFFEKHGGLAIIGARFLPFIRTFAPIIAGIVDMSRPKFMFYNITGSLLWVFSMLFAGHYLQKFVLSQFGFDLKSHLEVIVIGIVLVTTAPVIWKLFFTKKKASAPESATK